MWTPSIFSRYIHGKAISSCSLVVGANCLRRSIFQHLLEAERFPHTPQDCAYFGTNVFNVCVYTALISRWKADEVEGIFYMETVRPMNAE